RWADTGPIRPWQRPMGRCPGWPALPGCERAGGFCQRMENAGRSELVRGLAAEGAPEVGAVTPEWWRQIEQLYHAAQELAREDRVAMLAQADPGVRREVEAMLAQDASGKILDRPAKDLISDARLTTVATGSQLGPYQIEALLGS